MPNIHFYVVFLPKMSFLPEKQPYNVKFFPPICTQEIGHLERRNSYLPLLRFWATLPFRVSHILISMCAKFQNVITI